MGYYYKLNADNKTVAPDRRGRAVLQTYGFMKDLGV
jgi:hypothetical protein